MSESLIRLSGEIGVGTLCALEGQLVEFLDGVGSALWVVDLTDVTFMDASGLALLTALRDAAARRDASVTLRNPNAMIVQALRITGRAGLFDFDPPLNQKVS